MPVDPGPFDLESMRVILGPQGNATAKSVTPGFYEDLDREFGGFAGHVLVSRHEFAAPWSSWERHPNGDEIVYLIAGDVDLVLWIDDSEQTVHVDQPGSYVIVPQGTWHTARPRKPTSMLFITPGEGTQHAESPGAAAAT